jgi:hypothetical protein
VSSADVLRSAGPSVIIIFSGSGSCKRLRKTRWPSLLRRKLKLHTYCEIQPLTQNTSSPTRQKSWHIRVQYSSSFEYNSLSALYIYILDAGHCEGWALSDVLPIKRDEQLSYAATQACRRYTDIPSAFPDPKHPSLLRGTSYVHFPHSPLAAPLSVHLYSTRVQVNLDPTDRSPAGMPTRQSKPTCSHAYTHTTKWNKAELQDTGRHHSATTDCLYP